MKPLTDGNMAYCGITMFEAKESGRHDAIVKALRQLEHLTVREFTSLLG
jgi:hypothetical protein